MKTTIKQLRVAAIALFIFLAAGVVNAAKANGIAKKQMLVEYVGKMENLPVFQLTFDNVDEDEFNITIKDTDQKVLHSETVKGRNVSRKYGFDVDAEDLGKMSIVITSKTTNQSQVYRINNSRYEVENVTVARL